MPATMPESAPPGAFRRTQNEAAAFPQRGLVFPCRPLRFQRKKAEEDEFDGLPFFNSGRVS